MKRKRVYRTVRSSKVKEPLRLAVVADLHDKPFEDVMEDLSSCDAILVPGDLVSRHRKTFVFSERFLKEAPEAAPVFYSFGNHERKCAFAEEWRRKVKQSRVTFLDNESVGFRGIRLGGLTSLSGHGADTAFLDRFEKEDGFKLLMCHHPEIYRDYVAGRQIDFTVCGHAHGGQIQICGHGLYAPGQGFFPKLTHGIHDGGKMMISRGMSNDARAPRINNPLELIILTLEPGKEDGHDEGGSSAAGRLVR